MENILILGATGFIGRNLVTHLRADHPDAAIRAVDKKHWKLVNMSAGHEVGFIHEGTTFVQADLSKERSMAKAFNRDDGKAWDLVVNLTTESSHGASAGVYEERCCKVSVNCAKAAAGAAATPGLYVDFSTALVYASGHRHAATEDSPLKPWTAEAVYQRAGEEAVAALNLPLNRVVFRPAYVYGRGDTTSIMPRAVCAATYAGSQEVMKFLWDGSLKLNTVHVDDVCRAVVHAYVHKEKVGEMVFNLSDGGDTDQQLVNELLGTVFDIKVGFVGRLISNVARINLEGVAGAANEKHVEPWGKLCKEHDVNCVLTPFIHAELLGNNHLFVNGGRFCEETGFVYEVPRLDEGRVKEMLWDAVDNKMFPNLDCLKGEGDGGRK